MIPIFIDIDGTLLNSQKEITPATFAALNLARRNHYEPILCTGRPRDYGLELCKPLKSHYLIYNSGAGIYDCQTASVLYENIMDPSSILELYNLLQDSAVNFILAYNGTNHRYSLGTLTRYEPLSLDSLSHILNTNHIQQIVINGPDFVFMRSLRDKINQIPFLKTSNQSKCLVNPEIPPIASSFYYDIVDPSTSKGNGIKIFCELLSLSPKNCIAIGDDENDLSMFRVCGYSVAMGNALPIVKTAADYITSDNDHNGIAYFIENQLLN